jgi:hypothetical protein
MSNKKRISRAEYMGDFQILENLDWPPKRSTQLVEGGIRKDEIICAIGGQLAEILQEWQYNDELSLVIRTIHPLTKEVREVSYPSILEESEESEEPVGVAGSFDPTTNTIKVAQPKDA